MKVGSLFSGIGGFELGLEWAGGYEIAWQVEIDPWCRKVLQKHWPEVPKYTDIRDCNASNLCPVDIIVGGFPCQDISIAGKQEGLDGERSSLWWQMRRIIGELRPRFAIVENVPNLLIRGGHRVLGSLAEIGYDAEWGVISAGGSAVNNVGAPHKRERIWIVAYPIGMWKLQQERSKRDIGRRTSYGCQEKPPAYTIGPRLEGHTGDVSCIHQPGRVASGPDGSVAPESICDGGRIGQHQGWESEPNIRRVDYGIPKRMDRLKGLGNAIVPQIACFLGERINSCLQRGRAYENRH